MTAKKRAKKQIDYSLLFLTICLTIFGVLMVYNTSVVNALRDFQDKYFYARQQLTWAVLGLSLMFIFQRVHYRFWETIAPLAIFVSLVLLALVIIPGIGNKFLGARRWINIGWLNFQPAEAVKLSVIFYFSSFLSRKKEILRLLIILGIIVLLTMAEPDLGTTIIIVSTSLSLFFVSGASLFYLSVLGAVGFLGGLLLIFTSAYRRARLFTFFDFSNDPLGSSYHIRQILFALGSGGFFGLGLGASRQKYEYLPETMTDSIFAILAEELGFIGGVLLIFVFAFFVWRGFKIAREAPDSFGQLLAVGITSWIGIQTLINLAGMVSLVPLTGVPLPFVSYGGSSLVITLVGVGILLNISKYGLSNKVK